MNDIVSLYLVPADERLLYLHIYLLIYTYYMQYIIVGIQQEIWSLQTTLFETKSILIHSLSLKFSMH